MTAAVKNAWLTALLALVIALSLTACGGSGEGGPTVPTPQTPPPEQSQGEPAEHVMWSESWGALDVDGWVRHGGLVCNGSAADPDLPERNARVTGRWGAINGAAVQRALSVVDGKLRIDYPNHTVGFAILSREKFAHTETWSLSGIVDLEHHDGAWIGLTLVADESDYREIALRWDGDSLGVWVYAPCHAYRIAELVPGPRKLELVHRPGDGWEYRVDGHLLHYEPMTNLGAALAAPARVGLYVVNVLAEAGRTPIGSVVATVGELRVVSPEGT